MCGIVGYTGRRDCQPILLNCLGKLEYRGYDSCGLAILNDKITITKDAVRVRELEKVMPRQEGRTGIGHTRWATHGERSQINAHPHADCSGRIAVVHNGVINNFQALRDSLAREGHTIVSQTDTEVIPHLIEKYYEGNFILAVERALQDLDGAFTMIAVMEGESGLVATRKDSPLIVGIGDRENFLASDVPALLDYTNRVVYLEDGDIVHLTPHMVTIRRDGASVSPTVDQVSWSVEDAQKGGYEHFMLKEIHEQPKVIRDTLAEYIAGGSDGLLGRSGSDGIEDVVILACGTSYHAGLLGKYIFEDLTKVPVRVEIADEFIYSGRVTPRNRAIAITQSGETLDVLKAVRKLKESDCKVVGITNVVGSTISRVVDRVMYTRAGPEISVAATKTFIAELIALYWLAMPYAKVEPSRREELLRELRQLPSKVQQVLDNEAQIAEAAVSVARFENAFFIGKGLNYPAALEGALKLKEISYLHAEGYAAGELKHGPFALLGENTPVVAIITPDNTYEAMVTSLKEIKARHSPVLALAPEGDVDVNALADYVIPVPKIDNLFTPVINSVVLQLLAYYTARERGCPIDFPRNLAKSVTVE